MANECWNRVTFQGCPEKLERIGKLFEANRDFRDSFLSACCKEDEIMYNVTWDEEDTLYYHSNWRPCRQAMQKLADHFELEFCCLFEELGNCLYGAGFYKDSHYTEISLELAELDQYYFDKNDGLFYFEGMAYEQQEQILETLLERKINVRYPQFAGSLDQLL